MPDIGYIVTAIVLLIFVAFGIAAGIATIRRFVVVIRCGRFPRWDETEASFEEAPIFGGFYLLHLALCLVAAIGCIALPFWFIVRSVQQSP